MTTPKYEPAETPADLLYRLAIEFAEEQAKLSAESQPQPPTQPVEESDRP